MIFAPAASGLYVPWVPWAASTCGLLVPLPLEGYQPPPPPGLVMMRWEASPGFFAFPA